MTPPYMRISNFRSKYLKKRNKKLEEKIKKTQRKEEEVSFDYFDFITKKKKLRDLSHLAGKANLPSLNKPKFEDDEVKNVSFSKKTLEFTKEQEEQLFKINI